MRSQTGLAELAARQHGVVAAQQLLRLGYSRDAIARAVRAARLHRVHRGVYAVGHPRISMHGRCHAAVLACGGDAVVSHFGAVWLWGLLAGAPRVIDVTVARRGHRRKAIRVHHAPALSAIDRTTREGIPVTAVPRTLIDLAQVAPRRVRRAVERAEQLELFDLAAVESLVSRCGGHRGAAALRAAIDGYREPPFTRSELERRFLELVRRAGLPRPSVNVFFAGYEIDIFWERERFAVELDGYEHHRGRAAFERDRRRQEDLKIAGVEMIRLTARRVAEDPAEVAGRIEELLERRRHELLGR